MERKKSLLAATIISATLLTGAVAYAASSGVLEGRDDNVGNLQPTAIEPTDITIYVDPATGSVTTAKPQIAATTPPPGAVATATAITPQPAAAVIATPTDDSGLDSDDDSGHDSNDDRRHGRDSDDD
jgi:hypothetical protein